MTEGSHDWKIKALGESANGHVVTELHDEAEEVLKNLGPINTPVDTSRSVTAPSLSVVVNPVVVTPVIAPVTITPVTTTTTTSTTTSSSSVTTPPSISPSSVNAKIMVIEGNNLIAKDSNGKSDPYLKIKTLNLKSQIIKKNLNPIWDYSFQTSCSTPLDIEVWDHDALSDDFMGEVVLNLPQLCSQMLTNHQTVTDIWLELKQKSNSKEAVSGSIRIKVDISH